MTEFRHITNSPGLAPTRLRELSQCGADCAEQVAGKDFGRLDPERLQLFASARHGIYHGWKALGLPAGSAALLPAFVCDTVSKPLRMAGARLVYYRVGGDLAPDLEHAAQLLGRDAGIRALLWYHYLGFDRDAFRARLALHGVEAATHWPDWLLPAPHGLEFADAWRLSDTLLTLPCHQDLCEEHIDYAARMVQRCWRR